MKILYYTVVIFSCIHTVYPEAEWVDPFSMNVGFVDKSDQCICEQPTSESHVLVHYKRTINLLLASVAVDRSDPLYYKGRVSVKIPIDTYDLLRSFTKSSSADMEMLQRISTILSNAFIKPTVEELADMLTSWTDHMYFTFFNRTTGILLSILFIFFISYKLLRANFTLWSVTKYLIFIAWIVDFSFIWVRLLQDIEINKIADSLRYESIPPHCDPKQMSYFQYFWSSISGTDECRTYHKTILSDTFWQVSPFVVFSHQFGEMVVAPATFVGSGMAGFTSSIIGGLPFPFNILLLPFILIFTLVLTCVVLSFMTNTSFGFNLFHLVQLNFGNDQRKALGEYISGNTLNKILNTMAHRHMIENVVEQPSRKGRGLKTDKENSSDIKNIEVKKTSKTKDDTNGKIDDATSAENKSTVKKTEQQDRQEINRFVADTKENTNSKCQCKTMSNWCSSQPEASSFSTISTNECDSECLNLSSINLSSNTECEDISNLSRYDINCSDID